MLARLTRGLAAGDILLLHDGHTRRAPTGRPVLLEVLPALLQRFAHAGLRAVTCPRRCRIARRPDEAARDAAAATLTTALGASATRATLAALRAQRSGLAPVRFLDRPLSHLDRRGRRRRRGRPAGAAGAHDCRNNRLAGLGLQQRRLSATPWPRARARWGAHRVGVFLGTSTSGILQTELAYRHRDARRRAAGRLSLRRRRTTPIRWPRSCAPRCGCSGPAWVVSTACSSSAKVFGSAARLIDAGLIDAAVVGGVDSLCLTTLYGFNSLELLSTEICRPWDAARNGLSIGEAAAFALLERDARAPQGWLLGVGESSDGHHMSTPHPEGAGRDRGDARALADAGLQPGRHRLHQPARHRARRATTPPKTAPCAPCSAPRTPCSSTKGATGHTLGAAGGVEAAIACWRCSTA